MKSATRNGPGDHGNSVSPTARELYGKIRRMVLGVTSGLWQVIGHLLLDGKREGHDAEPFTGIGFYARPGVGSNPEAIVIFLGEGASAPTVIACRDEDVRRAVVGDLSEDETAMFNTRTMIIVRASGIVEIKAPGGVPRKVAFQDEVHAIYSWLTAHTHSGVTTGMGISGPPDVTSSGDVPEPEGSELLYTE